VLIDFARKRAIVSTALIFWWQENDMGSRIHALVIDDDDGDRLLVERALRVDREVNLVTAVSLEDGIEISQSQRIDVILLDLGLSETTGLETLVLLREHVSNVPIVVLTGMANDVALAAIELGAQDYIEKSDLNDRWISRCLRYAIQRHQLQLQLERQANIDGLTRLRNRQSFEQLLDERFARVKTDCDGCFAIGFIDLNEFKAVNDGFGHHVGDLVLCEFASRLRQIIRDNDVVARFGGDEFVVLLDGVQTDEQLQRFSRRLETILVDPIQLGEGDYVLDVSIGYAVCDRDCNDLRDVLRDADSAMYTAKNERPSRQTARENSHAVNLVEVSLQGADDHQSNVN